MVIHFINFSSIKNLNFINSKRMSPEVATQQPYTEKCDIWSLGITCIEMAELNPPVSKGNLNDLVTLTGFKSPTLKNKNSSKNFNRFVVMALKVDEKKRPTAKKLLNVCIIIL